MREIKFRAWDNDKGEMVRLHTLTFNWGGVLQGCSFAKFGSEKSYEERPEGEDMVLMQFIGLKDKNGKEIYEGDVVRIHNYKETWKHQEPLIDWRVFEIKWNRYLWQFNNAYISRPIADYDTKDLEPWDIEVIGNVWENPELLSTNKQEN